jgi:serine/threonine protein kinase
MPIRVEPQAEPIPGYKLIERLGGGGFGEVWKAEAPGGLLKAIKFVYGDMQTMGEESQRADQELKAMKRVTSVRHPYILSLERFDIIEGRLLIVMELADRNLWDRFKECRTQGLPGIPRDELLNYLQETAEALDLMNSQYQLQHLDIKPQNLFLVQNHIKVADFGLVKDLQDRMAATITGGVTPVYAAPETFDGWVSRFCDQYSLAIVYQELLTGQRPFSGNNVHQLVMQHVQGQPNLDLLSPEDQAVVGRALAKNPDERYPSCMDLVKALRSQGAEKVTAGAPPAPPAATPLEDLPEPLPGSTPESGGISAAEMSTKVGPPVLPSVPGLGPPHRPDSEAALLKKEGAISAPDMVVPEVLSEGQLVPALVVGLGQMGLAALKQLADELRDRFGSLAALPQIRLLYLDTDPNGFTPEPSGKTVLTRREILVARLNRAAHYLHPRPGRPRIDTWFDINMLYRIRRNPVTGGLRALGRLAFFGNYRTIALRLQVELKACTNPAAMATATQKTGLGPRSNQPLVFVVTSLAGGTGSGMFLDLAYVARQQLHKLGYPHPDVIGLFLLPAADEKAASRGASTIPLALGNTFAALTELKYFSSPAKSFTARYDEREPALTGSGPPFTRCIFLAASPEDREQVSAVKEQRSEVKVASSLTATRCPLTAEDTARLAGEYLYHELTTPLGWLTDSSRSTLTTPETRPPFLCQTFGLFRYSWPRHALLAGASRRFCRQLVERWLSKDAKPLQEPVRTLVQQRWTGQQLGAEALITRFQMACTQALGREPATAFKAITAPFLGKDRRLTEADRDAIREATAELEQLVGQPSDSTVLGRPGVLEEAIRAQGEVLNAEWQEKLSTFTLHLVDQPGLRLAGAEESLRLTIRLIEETLKRHETLSQELAANALKGYERLKFLVEHYTAIFRGRKPAQVLAELVELLQLYPKWRYQGLVLRRVIYTYTSLRGYLSDQIRELGFYRVRLGELLADFQRPSPRASTLNLPNGSFLYPAGCTTLDQAVQQLFPEATAAEFEDLDRRMQALLEHQFLSLRHVCSTPTLPMRNLEVAMLEEAEAYVANRLTGTDVVATYFTRYPGESASQEGLRQAFTRAAPPLPTAQPAGQGELAILAVPFGQEDRFRQLANEILPQIQVVASARVDDLVVYREKTHFTLEDLEHFGPVGEDAYEQLLGLEHFTPHSRLDIAEWRLAEE